MQNGRKGHSAVLKLIICLVGKRLRRLRLAWGPKCPTLGLKGERSMRMTRALMIAALAIAGAPAASNVVTRRGSAHIAAVSSNVQARGAADYAAARRRDDFAAMQTYRPGYAFWQHVFILPDHSIAYGSGVDGRLLAIFPTNGNWSRDAVWGDAALADILEGRTLARRLRDRREQVALVMEDAVGPVLHNATRGDALLPNALRYGSFLGEWGAIYERFGVPADIGLAQVILESGLGATRRSEANAVGFCQWLRKNWTRLNYFSPIVIQGNNQTTQAPYCAAYLSVLAAKYGSFIPALSEHNAGGTNVGRTLINGERLGAADVRARYFLGSKLARDLRELPGRQYADVVQSYGPRSYLYAEMVFGNSFNVTGLMASTPQKPIFAMRTARAISLDEIMGRTQLSADEVRRFNPALVDRAPSNATLYLPFYVSEFGADVGFWRRPASPLYARVLDEFMRLSGGPEHWDDPSFAPVLTEFLRRFSETNTAEGAVMATVLAYAMDQAFTSGRRALLLEFRESERVQRLFERGVLELDAVRRRSLDAQVTTPLKEPTAVTFLQPEILTSGAFRTRNIARP